MTQVLNLYDRLSSAKDDRTCGRMVADVVSEVELMNPKLSDLVTRTNLSEKVLRLQGEIEKVWSEIGQVKVQIEQLRGEFYIQLERRRANALQWALIFCSIAQFVAIMVILWCV